jgi:uncharacterized repeat protein (TIGR04076 family)
MDMRMKQIAVGLLKMSEEDMAKITPEQEEEFLNAVNMMGKYRMEAEVVSAKYCFAGLKEGQKYVIDQGHAINTDESTAPICVAALPALAQRTYTMMDRIYNGNKLDAPIPGFRCSDPGLGLHGLGTVEFKVTITEIDE